MYSKLDLDKLKKERIGEISYSTFGNKMTIQDYNNVKDITVIFEDGYIVKSTYWCFKTGGIRSLYDTTIYNVGYFGEGKYGSMVNGLMATNYVVWVAMISRCYNPKCQKKQPTYIGCTVCNEWHNFQNFAKWYDENYYNINNEQMTLDKDILFKDNKIYSPDTCVFVPERINVLFTNRKNKRGLYPLGVIYQKNNKNFVAQCNNNKKTKHHIGCFTTPELAFAAYKKFKENYIKEVAEEYKDQIPKNLYDVMYEYKIAITD